jgi:hypothetical protein
MIKKEFNTLNIQENIARLNETIKYLIISYITNLQKGTGCHSCKCRNLLNNASIQSLYSNISQEHRKYRIYLRFCLKRNYSCKTVTPSPPSTNVPILKDCTVGCSLRYWCIAWRNAPVPLP